MPKWTYEQVMREADQLIHAYLFDKITFQEKEDGFTKLFKKSGWTDEKLWKEQERRLDQIL